MFGLLVLHHFRYLALGKGIDKSGLNDIREDVGRADDLAWPGVSRDRLGVQHRQVHVHASARLEEVDHAPAR